MNSEINILYYLRIIKEKWVLLISILIIAETVTVIAGIKTPSTYISTTTIFPPEAIFNRENLMTNISLAESPEQLLHSVYDIGASTNIIMAMLRSRKMAEDAVRESHFTKLCDGKDFLAAASKLQSSTTISINKEQMISISIKSDNPELSASIANFYVSNLDRMNDELKITSLRPTVTVLDSAIPAGSPSSPQIKLSILTTGVVALFIGILLSFFVSYIQDLRMKNV
jgi:capsular polysaccharide biosynthesis protein